VKVEKSHEAPFVKCQQLLWENAMVARLRKLDGHIWRPVEGCLCAYKMAESYSEFINDTLRDERDLQDHPRMFSDLKRNLENLDPHQLRNLKFDDNLMSFSKALHWPEALTSPRRLSRCSPYWLPELSRRTAQESHPETL
jgi:hypothetical protein